MNLKKIIKFTVLFIFLYLSSSLIIIQVKPEWLPPYIVAIAFIAAAALVYKKEKDTWRMIKGIWDEGWEIIFNNKKH